MFYKNNKIKVLSLFAFYGNNLYSMESKKSNLAENINTKCNKTTDDTKKCNIMNIKSNYILNGIFCFIKNPMYYKLSFSKINKELNEKLLKKQWFYYYKIYENSGLLKAYLRITNRDSDNNLLISIERMFNVLFSDICKNENKNALDNNFPITFSPSANCKENTLTLDCKGKFNIDDICTKIKDYFKSFNKPNITLTLEINGIFNNYFPENLSNLFYNVDEPNIKPINIIYVILGGRNFRNVKNMSYLFNCCQDLKAVAFLQNFNTKNVKDMSNMFKDCKELTSLNLSNFNTQNVTNMSCMFSCCHRLTELDLRKLNTENVTDMSYMFVCCKSLTNLDLSNFNTKNVNNMMYMFGRCIKLKTVYLSNFNTKNVTNMKGMFKYCYKLEELDLYKLNTKNVTNMEDMFSYCKQLTILDLSNFNTSKVKNMINMFRRCNNLVNINLSNFDTKNVINMYHMFKGCKKLKELYLSNFDTKNVVDISYIL